MINALLSHPPIHLDHAHTLGVPLLPEGERREVQSHVTLRATTRQRKVTVNRHIFTRTPKEI